MVVEKALVRPVSELLARASSRQAVRGADARSGAGFERVVIDGERGYLKRVSRERDWIMRCTGDRVHRPFVVWQTGIMDRAPGCIDHAVIAMEVSGTDENAELIILMRDVGQYLVPEGDVVIPEAQHGGFIEHMAQLAASFWGFIDTTGQLTTMAERPRFFAPDIIAPELLAADIPGPVAAADTGWRALAQRSPLLRRLAGMIHDDPEVVTGPLRAMPSTFLQGDWKMGNLGTGPSGRTILLDWAMPGQGPACWDLCWYLALNRARLPESKEATILRFRRAVEAAGVDTAPWWQAQLDLCLIGVMATFGWEKALGDEGELRWWEDQVAAAVARLGGPLAGRV